MSDRDQTPVRSLDTVQARSGATLLLELLETEGVDYIFGNPGTTELPLMDALVDSPAISYILGLQEASVVAMADGYAQAAGRPGFLNLHTAGGLGHGMGNLLNAQASQTPLVVSVGQQDLRHSLSDPLLLGDIETLGTSAVKWTEQVLSASQLPILVRRAFKDCVSAPRGPVLLSLPMNVLEEWTSEAMPKRSVIDRRSIAGALPGLAEALAGHAAGKLAIIAGDEIHAADAAAQVVRIADLLAAPVYGASWPSRIPFPTSHPLWAGNLPTRATEIASRLAGFDAILALGGKSLIAILYSEGPALPETCAVYQLSADARDLGRTFSTPLSLVGDIAASLSALEPLLAQRLAGSRRERDALIAKRRAERQADRDRLFEQAASRRNEARIAPLVAALEVVRAIGPKTPIVDEAIVTSSLVRQCLNSDSATQYAFLRGGALGWGMPAAVGCSLGIGREPVVCLVGDGAALYSPQALWTAAHETLPVTFIVLNNRQYNVLKTFLRNRKDGSSAKTGRFIAMDIVDPAIDYIALARAMGVPAQSLSRPADIAPAVEAAIASNRPNLIEIVIGE